MNKLEKNLVAALYVVALITGVLSVCYHPKRATRSVEEVNRIDRVTFDDGVLVGGTAMARLITDVSAGKVGNPTNHAQMERLFFEYVERSAPGLLDYAHHGTPALK
jgi:hypothetical protein